jgi:RNA polymerase sigma-70 factor (ECF subfamily)
VSISTLAPVLTFPVGPLEAGRFEKMSDEDGAAAARVMDDNRAYEGEILARVIAGDTEAFEYFVRTYQKRIYRLAYTLLRDPSDADCVTQDVFVKAFRAVAEFKREAAFETWLTRIAINTVRDRIRRRKPVTLFSQLRGEDDEDGPEIPASLDPADGTSPERDMMSRDIRRRLADAIVSLSPRQRSVFVMKHYEEKSIAEISESTGLDEGTIKSHLFRAARKLRERLEDLR